MAVLRCTEAFAWAGPNGVPQVFTPGSLVDATDPVVKGHEQWFEPVEETAKRATQRDSVSLPPQVEAATAAPGEKRSVTKPAKS